MRSDIDRLVSECEDAFVRLYETVRAWDQRDLDATLVDLQTRYNERCFERDSLNERIARQSETITNLQTNCNRDAQTIRSQRATIDGFSYQLAEADRKLAVKREHLEPCLDPAQLRVAEAEIANLKATIIDLEGQHANLQMLLDASNSTLATERERADGCERRLAVLKEMLT